jgi:hypothetical protein
MATLAYRRAADRDVELLGHLNHELIRDEGHRNPMSVPELVERMSQWLAAEYTAILFEEDGAVVATWRRRIGAARREMTPRTSYFRTGAGGRGAEQGEPLA